MPARRNTDLHGNAPDSSRVALLILGVVNDLEFEGGAGMVPRAIRMARRIAALKAKASEAGVPVVYVNDNFGRWRSDFRRLVAHCLGSRARGRTITRLLRPSHFDYFVLKPKHSGFSSTTLDLLLEHLGARTLILTGLLADSCILFTAQDAHMRGCHLIVPEDCIAGRAPSDTRRALTQMRRTVQADTQPSTALHLRTELRRARGRRA